ncbi:MAG: hypothetical protein JW751_32560 [Polyangiaceae bacterium]|nr:hypothetical protein [Polyangiaceae bacterium]
MQGRSAFDAGIAPVFARPNYLLLEIFGVAIPLAFHALFGILLAFAARPRLRGNAGTRQSAYLLQRATGVVVVAFVLFHVGEVRLTSLRGIIDETDYFPHLCALLSGTVHGVPLRAILYLLGLAAATYHLANGLRGFCFGWGLTTSRRASQRVGAASAALGLALFALGATTVVYFATGLRLALSGRQEDVLAPRLGCGDVLVTNPATLDRGAGPFETGAGAAPSGQRSASPPGGGR